jgi:hypothetical protein
VIVDRRVVAALALTLAGPSSAAESYTHQGALGLYVAPGGSIAASSTPTALGVGPRWSAHLGGTLAFDPSGNEIALWLRTTGAASVLEASMALTYRGYFGYERVKTFFDLGLVGYAYPALMAGPRVGVGVQYEVSAVMGALCGAGLQLGLGGAMAASMDLFCGVQLRTYVLE